ncbi:MAG: hypothetical protein ACI8W8_005118 [Rhodothermales bacterium]|jgi:hypothetical protein
MLNAWLISGLFGAALAGMGWWSPVGSRRRALGMERIATRMAAGIGGGVILLYAGTSCLGLTPAIGLAIGAGLAGWGRLIWLFRRQRLCAVRNGSAELALLIVLGAGLASTGILASSIPRGFDPSFHSLISRILLIAQGIPHSWEPFERVQLNYPLGTHLLIASTSQLGCELASAFQACMWWFCAVQVPMTWLVARRILGHSRAALGATLIFALMPKWGAPVSFTLWGGLPMLIDQFFFLAFALLLLRRPAKQRIWLGGVLLAAIVMTHHLAALLIAAVLGLYLLTRPREWRFLLGSVGVQLLLASGFLIGFVGKLRGLGSTHALRFLEEPILSPMDVIQQAGPVFVCIVAAGLLWAACRRVSYPQGRFLLCWIGALAGGYIIFGQIYPRYMLATIGEPVMAFTPSRWATMLSSPLAIAAAWPLAQRWAWWIVLPLLVWGGTQQLQWPKARHDASHFAMYQRLDTILPANAFVLNTLTSDRLEFVWQAALSGREVQYSSLPASEPRDAPAIREKSAVMADGTLNGIRIWCETRGKPCFVLSRRPVAGATPRPMLEPFWQDDRFAVYRLRPPD